ncbi:PepSY-associated TM helix domain-containing protein [Bradyrhizobium sp. LHD-71]|uniref:PepSY-associated TM helix domain-containing protein n=1 Tax=Bradyrhizobium sp. LHD-71 TaxID=3072141 RepID=UPI00280F8EBA|nr:PepSY-associated TM helix domain-containing protein [Bradyrhizobium sp. LHD-71]MDQ8732403.1 PepSY-associated TM helix domain-containing protein [Bradyrhizobium sp. LHD-71]
MIRADIVKLYKAVHSWIGISCGFALFIAFYAGALTMFQEPIARWASPPAVGVAAVPLDDALRLLELVAAAHPEAREEGITLHLWGHENEPARVTWLEDAPYQEGQAHEHVHWWATLKLDGTLLAKQQEPSELAEFINAIHMRAGIPGSWGSYFMGVVSLLYGVALIAGVIVLLPSLAKDFLALRVGKSLKRMWLDAHNVVGVTALPFHIAMAITATSLSFTGPLWSVQESVVFGGKQAILMAGDDELFESPKPIGEAGAMMAPSQLLQKLKMQAPDYEPRVMIFRNFGDRAAVVRVAGAERGYVGDSHLGSVMLSAVTGELLKDGTRPSRQDPDRRASETFYGLHTGQYDGATIRWAYFFLGLSGAWLFYSGNLLWIETRRRKARKGGEVEQSRSTRLLGSATVGVCLGCVAGISLTIVAAKWLHGRVADLNAWHAYIYYAVFLGSVAWAFAWGVARSAVHLLWLCAAATMAIPLTTLTALLPPALGMWAHGSAATIGVDVVAFIGALCLAWMAISTARRVKLGPADSIWSIRKPENRTEVRESVAIAAE